MKKVITSLLILALLAGCVPALAESSQNGFMSDEYILENYENVLLGLKWSLDASSTDVRLQLMYDAISQLIEERMAAKESKQPVETQAPDDGQDPLIGVWYFDMEMADGPTMPQWEGYTRFIRIATFEESGDVVGFGVDFRGVITEVSGPYILGKWEKIEGNQYSVSIIGVGTETAYIKDDVLYLISLEKDTYYGYHKMIHMDWYTQILSK